VWKNIDNLNCKAGGENEKTYIQKYLSGEKKLQLESARNESDLVDSGFKI
jgi:hypothetical protein